MKFVANYAEWIPENFLDYIETLETGHIVVGDAPGNNKNKDNWNHPLIEKYKDLATPNYAGKTYGWSQWFGVSEEIQSKEIKLPELPVEREKTLWWVVRLRPGEFQPTHADPHLYGTSDPVRYTLFLQDWEPGHIFVYDTDKTVVNYKAGDLYEWNPEHVFELHGAANISYKPRYTIQIAMYNGEAEQF